MEVKNKIQFLEGSQKKTIYKEECLKRAAWTNCRCKKWLGKKEGVMFLWGGWVDIPVRTVIKLWESF